MQTKLTLTISGASKRGKSVTKKRNKSLSKLVSEYFKILTLEEDLKDDNLTPNVHLLYGALAGKKIDKSDYIEYLEKKHS